MSLVVQRQEIDIREVNPAQMREGHPRCVRYCQVEIF